MAITDHKKKFKSWQARVCAQTRVLSELIVQEIIPVFESEGFVRVNVALNRLDEPVSAREVRLERIRDAEIEYVYVFFAKHGCPMFQIGFARRKAEFPNEFIRSAHFVKNKNQYYHWWGKPWWHPLGLWSQANSATVVTTIKENLSQVLEYLETGNKGPNISLSSNAKLVTNNIDGSS